MTTKTYAEFRQEVLEALSMEDEDFVSDAEFVAFTNDALSECHSILLKTKKDYFLTSDSLKDATSPTPIVGLQTGVAEYVLPSNIYGNKVREIIYNDGSEVYEIKKMKGFHKFAEVAFQNNNSISKDYLEYFTVNRGTSEGTRLIMVPTPRETGNKVTIWYDRSVERLPSTPVGTEIIDIPEFYTYVKAAVSAKCALKEGHPRLKSIVGEWEYLRALMLDTLYEQTSSDDESEVICDLSHYENHT